ncbi:MAG: hypothetical protein U0575_11385 [Phycisphaerales bacterium]
MVATDDRCASGEHKVDALARLWPIADDVAKADDVPDAQRVDARQDRLQRVQVAVDIGDDGETTHPSVTPWLQRPGHFAHDPADDGQVGTARARWTGRDGPSGDIGLGVGCWLLVAGYWLLVTGSKRGAGRAMPFIREGRRGFLSGPFGALVGSWGNLPSSWAPDPSGTER